ncbi:MAG: Sensor protein ZraS [Verrucomicrobia bacterium ADurb.Bin474]|nr:MAG: Sensor protein ZraS [Verrucomicrobia bacterium ADurb.Bin474]
MLFNVLKNAVEAMPREGHLRIRTRADDEFVYLMVADTGCGMDPDDLANVFKPYFSTKKEGHGLGMMVVERIMRAHGAKIGIDSRKGKGTVVTLQFPQKHRRIRLLEQS